MYSESYESKFYRYVYCISLDVMVVTVFYIL